MSLKPYEFRSIEQLVVDVAAEVPLVNGKAYVALVADPSTEQRLVDVRRLSSPALLDDWEEASAELCEVMESFRIPESPRPPRHRVLTFVVRSGLCVLGPNEGTWMMAWRYSNHFANAYDGGVVLVTEHGWIDFMTDEAGLSPVMVP